MFPDQTSKDLMIKQGYVPATCTLDVKVAGLLIWSEINEGKNPCWGCKSDRSVCQGQAELVKRSKIPPEPVWTEHSLAMADRLAVNRPGKCGLCGKSSPEYSVCDNCA